MKDFSSKNGSDVESIVTALNCTLF